MSSSSSSSSPPTTAAHNAPIDHPHSPDNPTPLPPFMWRRHIVEPLLLSAHHNHHDERRQRLRDVLSLRATCRIMQQQVVTDELARSAFDACWTRPFAVVSLRAHRRDDDNND